MFGSLGKVGTEGKVRELRLSLKRKGLKEKYLLGATSGQGVGRKVLKCLVKLFSEKG